MTMTSGQLQARKTWILGNKKMNRIAPIKGGIEFHIRGFHKGDICCTRCDKYLNPNDPEEAKEITISPGGKRIHIPRYCDSGQGFGCAVFRTVPRHSKLRKKKVDEAHRY